MRPGCIVHGELKYFSGSGRIRHGVSDKTKSKDAVGTGNHYRIRLDPHYERVKGGEIPTIIPLVLNHCGSDLIHPSTGLFSQLFPALYLLIRFGNRYIEKIGKANDGDGKNDSDCGLHALASGRHIDSVEICALEKYWGDTPGGRSRPKITAPPAKSNWNVFYTERVKTLGPGLGFKRLPSDYIRDLDSFPKLPSHAFRLRTVTNLLVNIDHVATLRNARKESFPDPLVAAQQCLAGGAKGIVFHLREDRRHITDEDVRRFKAEIDAKLDFELSTAEEIVSICCRTQPELATLVPENRQEVTTESGLDAQANASRLSEVIPRLFDSGVSEVALFLDPDLDQIDVAAELGASAIELHTGDYANAVSFEARIQILERMARAAERAALNGMNIHAGHGLDLENYPDFATAVPHLKEVSIGFAIVARAVIVGIKQAVEEMNRIVTNTVYAQ